MCYPEVPVSSWRVAAHGWAPLPCSVIAQIDVRGVATPCEEDEEIEGRYEVEIDAEHANFAGDLALDVFHAKIGIEVLDYFEIRVFDAKTGRALALQGVWTITDGTGTRYLGKIGPEPIACYEVEAGVPGDALYACAEVFAENEKMAIEKMQKALNYPQASMTYRADCLDGIENKKGARPS